MHFSFLSYAVSRSNKLVNRRDRYPNTRFLDASDTCLMSFSSMNEFRTYCSFSRIPTIDLKRFFCFIRKCLLKWILLAEIYLLFVSSMCDFVSLFFFVMNWFRIMWIVFLSSMCLEIISSERLFYSLSNISSSHLFIWLNNACFSVLSTFAFRKSLLLTRNCNSSAVSQSPSRYLK